MGEPIFRIVLTGTPFAYTRPADVVKNGRGTAAYMLPLTVTMVNRDGRAFSPTRWVIGPDPLANDQDAALYNCMASGLFGEYGESPVY